MFFVSKMFTILFRMQCVKVDLDFRIGLTHGVVYNSAIFLLLYFENFNIHLRKYMDSKLTANVTLYLLLW